MSTFVWEGTNVKGRKVNGEIEAKDVQAVFNYLKGQRIVPNIKKIREKGKGIQREIKIPGFGPKVRGRMWLCLPGSLRP